VAEKSLGRHDDERLAELAVDLSAEGMEVVGRSGNVANLPVGLLDGTAVFERRNDIGVVVGLLEEALETSGRVLGALAFVAVREEHNETRLLLPLVFLRSQKLVDDDLGTVSEVAELSLPENESIGGFERVAEFKAKDAEFGEVRVRDGEGGLVGGDIVERNVLALGGLVVDDGVAVGEGTTFDVLAA